MAKLSKSEFMKSLADIAGQLKQQLDNIAEGFDASPAAVKERRARAENDFEFFARTYFPHYIRPKLDEKTGKLRPVEPSLFHKWFFGEFLRLLKSKKSISQAIAAPRGEAKTTYLMIGLIHCIVYGRKHYILFIQDVFEQAALIIESIKAELEFNQRLKCDFPEAFGRTSIWKTGVFISKNNIKVHARGAGQKIRGLKHGAYRPDMVILDDMENDEEVKNPTNRDNLESWLNKAIKNLGEAGAKLDVFYIGTILHYDSVLNRTLNNPLWRSVIFRAVMTPPENQQLWQEWQEILTSKPDAEDKESPEEKADKFYFAHKTAMDKGAVLSWPDKRDLLTLMKIKVEVGTAAFDAEYQNDPLSGEDATFAQFTYWNVLAKPLPAFGAVDPSLGKFGRRRDPSAILVGFYDRNIGVLYLQEAAIKKRLPDKIISDMIYYQKKYNCVFWFVETVQYQEFLRTEAIKRGKKAGVQLNCIGISQNVDKDLRIQTLQPHVAEGSIRFLIYQTALIQQMRHWPVVDHDDGVDCLEILWSNCIKYAGSSTGRVSISSSLKAENKSVLHRVIKKITAYSGI